MLTLADPSPSDPVPSDAWREQVKFVLHARGTTHFLEQFEVWAHGLAHKTKGALYRHADHRFLRIPMDDDTTQIEERAKALIEAGDVTALTAWIRELEAALPEDPVPFPTHRALDAVRRVAIPALGVPDWIPTIAALADLPSSTPRDPIAAVNPSFRLEYQLAITLDDLLVAASKTAAAASYPSILGKAVIITMDREHREDLVVPLPRTTETLIELMVGVAAGHHRAKTRFERFSYHRDSTRLLIVQAAAEGWSPAPEVIELATSLLPAPTLVPDRDGAPEQSTLAALVAEPDFASKGTLARVLHESLQTWRAGTGDRTRARTTEAFAFYEKYKNDPMVREPRSHDGDLATYRWLNSALWGHDRAGPRLPEDVIMLICDRRFDDARAAYLEHFPHAAARADQAIADAREFFARDER